MYVYVCMYIYIKFFLLLQLFKDEKEKKWKKKWKKKRKKNDRLGILLYSNLVWLMHWKKSLVLIDSKQFPLKH